MVGGEGEMVQDLLSHTLLRVGLLGLSVSLIWVWRRCHAATRHAITRATRRSAAYTPCPGLTHKPSCATGEDGAQERAKALSAAPSPMVPIRGGPRTVDTQPHFCPSPRCDSYGWVGCGNVRANGHPSGGRWRQLVWNWLRVSHIGLCYCRVWRNLLQEGESTRGTRGQ